MVIPEGFVPYITPEGKVALQDKESALEEALRPNKAAGYYAEALRKVRVEMREDACACVHAYAYWG